MSNKDITRAMVLAAGEGTRLRPLTLETPKVLVPVGGVPLICYTLAWLRSHGVREVVINLYHLGDRIKKYLDDGSHFGMKVHYSSEERLLGTAGGVKKAGRFFPGAFVVVYGDVLTDFDLSDMMGFHRAKGGIATLALTKVVNPRETGIVQLDKDDRVVSFVEKPSGGAVIGDMSNGGVYILEKEVLQFIPRGRYCDFAYDVFPRLIEFGCPVYGYRLKSGDYLIDIGSMDRYERVNKDIAAKRVRLRHGQQSGIPG